VFSVGENHLAGLAVVDTVAASASAVVEYIGHTSAVLLAYTCFPSVVVHMQQQLVLLDTEGRMAAVVPSFEDVHIQVVHKACVEAQPFQANQQRQKEQEHS